MRRTGSSVANGERVRAGGAYRGPSRRARRVLPVAVAIAVLAAGSVACRRAELVIGESASVASSMPPVPPSVKGVLRVSLFGATPLAGTPLVHETVWVNGPDYAGMEDNDLRGFLDGRWIYGWNQPGQIHNRMGRRGSRPRWGETELFRTLVRWQGVRLPSAARVHEVEMTLEIEEDPDRPLDVMLYAVKHDWNPGSGGELGDNTSPPKQGEVWWGALAEGERGWGFPGVGYASESDPEADTPVTALAEAHLEPGQASLSFSSPALARYVEQRASRGLPLDFLLKLSDTLEDTPGTVLYMFSGNHGDRRNPSRRPRLRVRYEAPSEVARLERAIHLENGRTLELEAPLASGGRLLALSFLADEGHEAPTLEVRRGGGPWRRAAHPLDADGITALRLRAAHDPLPIGASFETGFRDTWVRSGPPEEQKVEFTFVSPRGEEHEVEAAYEGNYTWSVAFTPTELGRWHYRWESRFLKRRYKSAEGVFDVVSGDLANVERALRSLLERVVTTADEPSDAEVRPLAPPFWKLERAVYQLATPAWFASAEGEAMAALMTEVRTALSGRGVPETLEPTPMRREF